MQTIKLKYQLEDNSYKDLIINYMKQYSNCLHFMFNRIQDNAYISEKELRTLSKQLNNIELLDFYFIQCSIKEAFQLNESFKSKSSSKLIFGGKKNFFNRMNNKLSKEEYKMLKLNPIYSIGTSGKGCTVKGNQKFRLADDLNYVIFQPKCKLKIKLIINKLHKNQQDILSKLYLMQENKSIAITYKLDLKYIYISFDEAKLSNFKQIKPVSNRVLALDLNPNYIGWSIVDWKSETDFKLILSGVYSFKQLNNKELEFKNQHLDSSSKERIYLNNKRKHEIIEISKVLINKALHYKVEIVSIEDLNIKSKNHSKGKNFNKLVNNQWLRFTFTNNLNKRCNIFKIKLLKVKPEYSSFIGNILYRNLNKPDMVLASIEIGRRAYEFYNQYITKKHAKQKNIVQPDILKFNDLIIKSLEEFNIKENFKDFVEMFFFFKNSKLWYRVPLSVYTQWFKVKCHKSNISYAIY